MTDLVVYYGTTMPDRAAATAVTDTDVVLQPYHPVVIRNEYRGTFPGARRFVYVNPTSIDPWRFDRMPVTPPLLEVDDAWSLPRVDLTTSAGWRASIAEAEWALSPGPDEVDGVFVDDLDRMGPFMAHAFLAELQETLGWAPALFLNRGFDSWEGTTPAAVLIEDVRGADVAEDDALGIERWVGEVVMPAILGVRETGSAVHRIEYADTASVRDHSEPRLVSELFDSVWMTAPRSLDDWPNTLKRNGN